MDVVLQTPVRRRGDKTRQDIMDAALDLFEERGYASSTVPEIAERAGIATGTIYIYFKTKEALVNALYQYWRSDFSNIVYAGTELYTPGEEQITTVWQAMASYAERNRKGTSFLVLHRHAGYLDEESQRLESEIYTKSIDWVKWNIRKGVFGPQADHIAVGLVWGCLTGFLKFSMDLEGEEKQKSINAYGAAIWRALKPPC